MDDETKRPDPLWARMTSAVGVHPVLPLAGFVVTLVTVAAVSSIWPQVLSRRNATRAK